MYVYVYYYGLACASRTYRPLGPGGALGGALPWAVEGPPPWAQDGPRQGRSPLRYLSGNRDSETPQISRVLDTVMSGGA